MKKGKLGMILMGVFQLVGCTLSDEPYAGHRPSISAFDDEYWNSRTYYGNWGDSYSGNASHSFP